MDTIHSPSTLWAIERGNALVKKAVTAAEMVGSYFTVRTDKLVQAGVDMPEERVFPAFGSVLTEMIHNPSAVRPALQESHHFREAIASIIRYTGVPCTPENVITAQKGAEQLLHHVFDALFRSNKKGRLVLYPELQYAVPATLIRAAGGLIVPTASTGGQISAEQLLKATREFPEAKILFLMDPVNPTGRKLTAEQCESLAKIIREKQLFVILDETGRIFGNCYDPTLERVSLAALLPEHSVALYSALHAFGLPQHLGFGAAPSWLVGWMDENKNRRMISNMMQQGMTQAAEVIEQNKAQAYVEERREHLKRESQQATEILGDHNLEFSNAPQAGSYAFLEIPESAKGKATGKGAMIHDSMAACEALKENQNVTLFPAEGFLSNEFGARVSTRKRSKVIQVAQAMVQFMQQLRAPTRVESLQNTPPPQGRGR